MPDRLPPSWGREPEDGRDLDALLPPQPLSVEELMADEALLSGQMTGISDSQRPVAGAMFALRAAPAANELAGEAAARAAFRALIEPAGPVSTGTVSNRTLVLPVPAARQGPRPPARHRHRRRTAGGRGWRVVAAVGSAAAVVVVIGVAAYAGAFSGSARQPGQHSSPSAVAVSTPHGGGSTPQGVLGDATKVPTPSATPKASATPGTTPSSQAASRGSELCREYFRFDYQADKAARHKVFRELSKLAGTDEFSGVWQYCNSLQDQQHLFTMPPEPTSNGGSWPWLQGADGQGNSARNSGAGTGQAGSGKATSGPGNSGHKSNDSGSGRSQ